MHTRLPYPKAGRLISAALLTFALLLGGCSDPSVKLDNVTVQNLQQKPVDLASLKGKPAVVTFWATTCPGCVAEIPHMIALQQQYGDRGIQVVGIAMSYDPLDQIRAMVRKKNIPYTVWQDKTGAAAATFGPVRLTPTTFVLDAKGTIVYQKIGAFNVKRVDALLDKMARKKS